MDSSKRYYHPFEVIILKGLQNEDSLNFAVNAGKVFNFYNPLNYRKAKYDALGVFLPNLPYKVVRESIIPSESWQNTSFEFSFEGQNAYKINIYLMCSFNPPSKWVSGTSYIPMIDNVWIICKYFFDENDSKIFAIKGQTKNQSSSNIKFEAFDFNKTSESLANPNNAVFLEDPIDTRGNAVNLGIIASLNKQDDDTWQVSQFLKENYPLMDFFNSNEFEFCNTTIFNQNVFQEESISDDSVQYQRNDQRKKVLNLIKQSSTVYERGYIKYTSETFSNASYQLKLPSTNSPAEYLSYYSDSLGFSDPRFL